ncbi:NAD(P)-binding protein [Aspergillus uvarum CBS 121591]|uniref:NAD(P)-binding protein n=1 Tax=Aspergillus uvarum CBS 121591 TaxID=1448315 RepID=A0A319C9K2_9EURO|nr:NAD(P)-binding protein [Aspergillus uvarum CBS 121591]PYH82486.1 NAD(P)-binding protein [Aspergillus uvarum CBS 121591]
MTIIAVAGGTGGVGKTIVETLLEETTHKIIILTRSTPQDPPTSRTHHLQINYSDIPALAHLLTTQGITTIISAIGITDSANSQAQLNLIDAAEQSPTVTQFIPSEYSFIQTPDHLEIDPSIKHWLAAANKLQHDAPSLKSTRVIPGFFMDYWGMPHARTHLQPGVFGIDVQNCRAAIPGDGNDRLCMTYTYDMARFVVRLLEEVDAAEWPEFSVVVGDVVTYNQLLGIVEEVRGRKFSVVYDSPEKINQGQVTIPAIPEGYTEEEAHEVTVLVSRLTIAGVFDLPVEGRLNERFPEIEPVKVREFLVDAWKGRG